MLLLPVFYVTYNFWLLIILKITGSIKILSEVFVSVNVYCSTPYLQKLYGMEPLIMNFVLDTWLAMLYA